MPKKTDPSRQHIVRAYKDTGKTLPKVGEELPPVDEAVKVYAYLVWRQARRYSRTSGGVLDFDDLVSVGTMGLIQAHANYDPAGGRPFETYAEFRVRGAILDELRRFDPMSQPSRRKARSFEKSVSDLANRLGYAPNEQEIADFLEISLEQVQTMRSQLRQINFVSSEAIEGGDIRVDLMGSNMDRSDIRMVLVDALERIPERDRQVLALYYFHDLSLREIGEVLEVTEARVCQLHKAAVVSLRELLAKEHVFD
jgi:RNA polymerase sigma factor for flagellar operon FliA